MSGQFSDVDAEQRHHGANARTSAIMIYITFRFEFKYGIAAVIGLAHDVVVTLAFWQYCAGSACLYRSTSE